MFQNIQAAPPDSILGLTEAWKNDPNPRKVNLGVGVYKDENGNTPILASVKAAEAAILKSATTKSYMPIAGAPEYRKLVQDMIFGAGHELIAARRARTAHTPGGTAALRVGADFLKKALPQATVWLSSPTWANHKGVFGAAGFKTADYPYYDASSKGLDFGRLVAALEQVPAGDVVLLHACCHNPTGVDLTAAQWSEPSMRSFAALLDGRARASAIRRRASDATVLICLNAYHDAVVFTLPETVVQNRWVLLIDTHLPLPDGRREFTTGEQYTVTGRSLVVFGLEAEEGATRQVLLGLEETIYEAARGNPA